MSDKLKELLKDGVVSESHLMQELYLDIKNLVSKYVKRAEALSYFSLGWNIDGLKSSTNTSNRPENVKEKITTYLNVLEAIQDPISYDCVFYELMVMDSLSALKDSPYWEEALGAYKKKADELRIKQGHSI